MSNESLDNWIDADGDVDQPNFTTKGSKLNAIINVIQNNFYGCDIFLCLFMAAVQSYRIDRCLRPFPVQYVHGSNKDVDALRIACGTVSSLDNILKHPEICSNKVIDLLLWLFCQKEQPILRKISSNLVNTLTEIKKSLHPHYIFEVVYPEKSETTWQKRKGSRRSFMGFHGSQLDSFYSILKVGLQHHLSSTKELLYGKGIYLTSDITVSMPYAPFSLSWQHSKLGNQKSIIAVCEIIDDIDKVKCKDERFKHRALNQDSMSGRIPDKYIVVTDSEMIRLKYLFVYQKNNLNVRSWISNNFTLVLIGLYVIFLISIGFFQGPTWARIQSRLYKMIFT